MSVLKNLQQAHDAFIFGAPFATLALMRSIMEAVLRDHYGAQGDDLRERINNARAHLPSQANVLRLHQLRKLANTVLHLDPMKDGALAKIEPANWKRKSLRCCLC
jgi:hypothetical protein